MISKSTLEEVIIWQLEASKKSTYQRAILSELDLNTPNFAYVISGIRRCGKSTLVHQIMQQHPSSLYLNFDTPSLYGFEMNDFRVLDTLVDERRPEWLFFDEMQVVQGWEVYVRSKLEQGYRVVVTGSNSSMLSRELGTRLTGRHLSYTLYPFSYSEYLGFRQAKPSADTMREYLRTGGMPEYVKTGEPRIISDLISDILYRDILVRYNLRDEQALKNLFVYLMGNIGNLVSANKLTSVIGVKSSATVGDYFTYLENSFLVKFVSKYSYSYKSQMLNPKKVYSIDLGLHAVSTPSFSQDTGHRLENEVCLELIRKGYELYYFSESQHECDFVLCRNNAPEAVVQVCESLTHENEHREVSGLVAAMEHLHLDQGLILTLDQNDLMYNGNREIRVLPVWEWLTSEKK